MKVDVKETTLIQPAQETPNENLPLSNLDLFHAKMHVRTVHIYEPIKDPRFADPSMVIRVLKDGLSKVLVPFYPVAGRLGRDENGRVEIKCNGRGALFIVAECDDATIMELSEDGFSPKPDFNQLCPTIDYSADVSSYPLFFVQVTFFKCGGICLGMGAHHHMVDGVSGLHLINSWAEMARGLSLSVTPIIDRTMFRNLIVSSPTFTHPEFNSDPTMKTQEPDPEPNSKTFTNVTLKITVDQINRLKTKAGISCTTYETLVAHIWRCTICACGLSEDQETKLYMAVDGRARFIPPFPKSSFANITFPISPVGLCGNIVKEDLNDTVLRIRNAIHVVDDKYLRSALGYLKENPEALSLRQSSNVDGCPTLSYVNWIRLPFYGADFGWGPPIHVGPAGLDKEGKGYLMANPNSNGDGSLMLVICLEKNCLETFKKLFYEC